MTASQADDELTRRVLEASQSSGRETDKLAICAGAKRPRIDASATVSKGTVDLGASPVTRGLLLREDRVDSRPDEKAFFDDACARIFDGAND